MRKGNRLTPEGSPSQRRSPLPREEGELLGGWLELPIKDLPDKLAQRRLPTCWHHHHLTGRGKPQRGSPKAGVGCNEASTPPYLSEAPNTLQPHVANPPLEQLAHPTTALSVVGEVKAGQVKWGVPGVVPHPGELHDATEAIAKVSRDPDKRPNHLPPLAAHSRRPGPGDEPPRGESREAWPPPASRADYAETANQGRPPHKESVAAGD